MLILKPNHTTGLSGSLAFAIGLLSLLTEKDKYRHKYRYSFINCIIFVYMYAINILSKFVPRTGIFLQTLKFYLP